MRPRAKRSLRAPLGLALAASWTQRSPGEGCPPPQQATRSLIQAWEGSDKPPRLGARVRPASVLSLCAVAVFFSAVGAAAASLYFPLLLKARRGVQVQLVAVKAILFPDTLRCRRTYLPLEILFCALLTANAVLELLCFPNSKRSRLMRGTMHGQERSFFRQPRAFTVRRRLWILALFFARQVSCLQTPEMGADPFEARSHTALYVWSTNRMCYIGRTALLRNDARADFRIRSGPITRVMEHYVHSHNLQSKEARRRRYKLARCAEADLHSFFVPRVDETDLLEPLETYAINRLSPNGNDRKKTRTRRTRTQNRPPRGVANRKRLYREGGGSSSSSIAPLDSVESRSFAENRNRSGTQPSEPKVSRKQALEFADSASSEAYRKRQQLISSRTKKEGPLNLYDPRNKTLLSQWMVKGGVTVDWRRADDFWGTADSPLVILPTIMRMDSTRKLCALRKLNSELDNRRLPRPGGIRLKASTPQDAKALKSRLKAAVSKTHVLTDRQKDYLKGQIKVAVARLRNLRWMRNGISGTKKADLSTVRHLPEAAKEYYSSGKDVVRVPGTLNISPPFDEESLMFHYEKQSRSFIQRLRLSQRVRRGCLRVMMSGFQLFDPRADPTATTHHEAYADVVLHTPSGCFLVPEDKSSHESSLFFLRWLRPHWPPRPNIPPRLFQMLLDFFFPLIMIPIPIPLMKSPPPFPCPPFPPPLL